MGEGYRKHRMAIGRQMRQCEVSETQPGVTMKSPIIYGIEQVLLRDKEAEEQVWLEEQKCARRLASACCQPVRLPEEDALRIVEGVTLANNQGGVCFLTEGRKQQVSGYLPCSNPNPTNPKPKTPRREEGLDCELISHIITAKFGNSRHAT